MTIAAYILAAAVALLVGLPLLAAYLIDR